MRQKFVLLEHVGLVMWSEVRAMAGDSEPGVKTGLLVITDKSLSKLCSSRSDIVIVVTYVL